MTIVTAEFSMMPFSSLRSFCAMAAKWLTIAVCASGVIGLLSLNRMVFAVVWPLLYTVSAIVAYFIVSIGTSITPGVVDLAVANGFSMWATLISGKLILIAVSALIVSALIAYYRCGNVTLPRMSRVIIASTSIIALGVCLFTAPSLKIAVKARLPLSLYYSVIEYLDSRVEVAEVRTTYDGVTAMCVDDAPDVYLVIGESLRADHLPQNGYGRNTMPIMSGDTAMVSYSQIHSDAWFTHASVPIIMTDTDSLTRDDSYCRQSFITLFNKAGYNTAWFANQDLSPSYTYFAHEADTLIYCSSVMSVYTYAKYLDSDILPLLAKWRTESSTPRLAVLHTIGSHWWYKSHYPDRPDNFMPEIDSHDVASMSHEQMINSYDNTILETDRFLASLTEMLSGTNSVVLYISDHGENLGEDGMYLHTVGLEPTLHPACLMWYTDEFANRYPDKIAAIKLNASEPGNTDQIFNTIIDIAGLKTSAFNPTKSLLYGQGSH
ncbi:MAG: phosphoethanolamine transferase [Muribaculaceae bacterium]|nr:phosphoethanolamine transferase [Muribaculaceae bacterium]